MFNAYLWFFDTLFSFSLISHKWILVHKPKMKAFTLKLMSSTVDCVTFLDTQRKGNGVSLTRFLRTFNVPRKDKQEYGLLRSISKNKIVLLEQTRCLNAARTRHSTQFYLCKVWLRNTIIDLVNHVKETWLRSW